jgi:hypothetical protein
VNKIAVKEYIQKPAATGSPHRGANAMCEKCDKIDRNIRRYRWIQRQIFDRMTIDGTQRLIDKLEAEKATLHPAPHGGTE